MWYVYILLCVNDSFYTGIALDPKKRLIVHQKGKGAQYTKIYKPIKIIYLEQVPSHSEAMKRERELKSWPRNKKEKLVKSYTPASSKK